MKQYSEISHLFKISVFWGDVCFVDIHLEKIKEQRKGVLLIFLDILVTCEDYRNGNYPCQIDFEKQKEALNILSEIFSNEQYAELHLMIEMRLARIEQLILEEKNILFLEEMDEKYPDEDRIFLYCDDPDCWSCYTQGLRKDYD